MTKLYVLKALRKTRFLSGLSDEELDKLAGISTWLETPANTTIFSEGNDADELYLIANGRVELSMNIPEKGMLPILTLENGDLLGGSAALLQGEMTLNATTVLDTSSIQINAQALRKLCDEDHDIGYQFMRRVAMALMNRLVATRLQVLDVHRDALVPLSPVPSDRNQ